MSLSPPDQAHLASILKRARELEQAWPKADRRDLQNLSGDPDYQILKREVASCDQAEGSSLKRLASHVVHFHDQISLAHFYGCIVPFERLSNRALRDDEFLVHEQDGLIEALEPVPLKLIVENLRSAFNVGALFRTAECLGLSELLLCGYTPDPHDEKTARTAMGTSAKLPWRRVDRARTACEQLRAEGYRLVALETAAQAPSLYDLEFNAQPTALVLGNERFGIETDTLHAVDALCRIPMRGVKNSMNVGIAFGIGAFEWLRQYQQNKK